MRSLSGRVRNIIRTLWEKLKRLYRKLEANSAFSQGLCCKKYVGITMWEFSLMRDGRLLQDRECFAHLDRMMRQLAPRQCWNWTVRMVRHDVDHTHITARNFPSTWIAKSILQQKVPNFFARCSRVHTLKQTSSSGGCDTYDNLLSWPLCGTQLGPPDELAQVLAAQ